MCTVSVGRGQYERGRESREGEVEREIVTQCTIKGRSVQRGRVVDAVRY